MVHVRAPASPPYSGSRGRQARAGRQARCAVGRGTKSPSELDAGDLDPRVLQLVAAVDGGEDGGDALQRAGVAERADVEDAETHRAAELRDRVPGAGVPAADQQVALDRVIGLGQLVRGDVMER